jgi:hypothetical protein
MSQKLCARTHKPRAVMLRLSLLGALALATIAFGNAGCEDKKIGLPCDVLSDAGPPQFVYNPQALECPSRICVKPAADPDAVKNLPDPVTGPLCSASCSQDSDCSGGSLRPLRCENNTKPCPGSGTCSDKTQCTPDYSCTTGFACAIAASVGPLACQKLCLCKDFAYQGVFKTPAACQ